VIVALTWYKFYFFTSLQDSWMADATAEISREKTVNAHRPPQSHVAGLGMNEMNATIEYKETIVTARLMRKFFIVFDLFG
jgi:hypothetical protein